MALHAYKRLLKVMSSMNLFIIPTLLHVVVRSELLGLTQNTAYAALEETVADFTGAAGKMPRQWHSKHNRGKTLFCLVLFCQLWTNSSLRSMFYNFTISFAQ